MGFSFQCFPHRKNYLPNGQIVRLLFVCMAMLILPACASSQIIVRPDSPTSDLFLGQFVLGSRTVAIKICEGRLLTYEVGEGTARKAYGLVFRGSDKSISYGVYELQGVEKIKQLESLSGKTRLNSSFQIPSLEAKTPITATITRLETEARCRNASNYGEDVSTENCCVRCDGIRFCALVVKYQCGSCGDHNSK